MENRFRIRREANVAKMTLCVEDVVFKDLDTLIEYKLVENFRGILIFRDAFKVPSFKRYYASKIKGVKDPYLLSLIYDLLFMNPNHNPIGLKRITELIGKRFVATKQKPSEIKPDQLVDFPVLSYEEIYPVVANCAAGWKLMEAEYVKRLENREFIMYPENCGLDRHQKRSLKAQIHREKARGFYGEAIHHTVEYLIADNPYVKLTYPRILQTRLVAKDDGSPLSARLIRQHMFPYTKEKMGEFNQDVPFKSIAAAEKFRKYVELDQEMSLNQVASLLGVSKSKALAFRKLKNNL